MSEMSKALRNDLSALRDRVKQGNDAVPQPANPHCPDCGKPMGDLHTCSPQAPAEARPTISVTSPEWLMSLLRQLKERDDDDALTPCQLSIPNATQAASDGLELTALREQVEQLRRERDEYKMVAQRLDDDLVAAVKRGQAAREALSEALRETNADEVATLIRANPLVSGAVSIVNLVLKARQAK